MKRHIVAQLCRDARRYRWLRENISEDGQFFMVGRVLRSPEDFDAAIDAELDSAPEQNRERTTP